MSDEEEESGPVVELGEGNAVEGTPFARLASRLHYGIGKSEVVRRVGDTEIRTPDGPRTVESVLGDTDETYFTTRESLESTVRDVVGTGPVPTTDEPAGPDDDADEDADADDTDDE
ncbi:DUF5789 family protein [Halomarina ordinaria]|uniref:DUF5789 family protein n=1 Tax=Halomarina ordinaria TaxID=3033939 RepID=A0ABD5UDD9_9EURY|nr:DUF5789 family protein [Halomarina sp. PSRA2]